VTSLDRGLGIPGDDARMVVGVIAIAVLLGVLMLREMARVEAGGERARRVDRLRFATVPLSLVFIGVVAPRILGLLT
jgi:hypothetical protein